MTPLKPLFLGRRANMGATIFLAVIIFNIIMYIFIRSANADALMFDDSIGSYDTTEGGISDNTTSTENLSVLRATHWYDGFRVSVFDLPWYVNIFYGAFQAVLISLSIYMLIRGLN